MKNFIDIERELENGRNIAIKPEGYSMYPFFRPGKDIAYIKGISYYKKELKPGDIVLFRNANNILVLHRIYKVSYKGYFLIGDNQTVVEGPVSKKQIKGVLFAYRRFGKETKKCSCNLTFYLISRLCLWLVPKRQTLFGLISKK